MNLVPKRSLSVRSERAAIDRSIIIEKSQHHRLGSILVVLPTPSSFSYAVESALKQEVCTIDRQSRIH